MPWLKKFETGGSDSQNKSASENDRHGPIFDHSPCLTLNEIFNMAQHG